jgi:hypothetical protein
MLAILPWQEVYNRRITVQVHQGKSKTLSPKYQEQKGLEVWFNQQSTCPASIKP